MVNRDIDRERIDEDLSALVDGELAPEREAQVRAAVAEDPALADRLATFSRLEDTLRALPERPVPRSLEARVLSRVTAEARPLARGPRRAAPRRRARWTVAAPAAAALAAGLALYLTFGSGPAAPPIPTIEPSPAAGTSEIAQRDPSAESGAAVAELTEADLVGVPEEEIEIALELDTLADFDLIEQLEVLELLAALEEEGQG